MIDRKALLRRYKDNPPVMGVYRIRNTVTGGYLLGSSASVPGALNRHRFELEMGSGHCRGLQTEWIEHGVGAFAFETLDTLDPSEDPGADPAEELELLEGLWRCRLLESGTGSEYGL